MKRLVSMLLLACVFLSIGCQQHPYIAKEGEYCNPEPFDPQTMAVVMVDQDVYVEAVDGKKYKNSVSIWEAKATLQENLIVKAGSHTVGVRAEMLFHHVYGLGTIEISFTAQPDKIYRIMKASHKGEKIIGIFEKNRLVAEASRK